jgi:hypothetical protein
MGKIRLNTVKHYTGTFAELPAKLPYGDTYFSTDDQRPVLTGYTTMDMQNMVSNDIENVTIPGLS